MYLALNEEALTLLFVGRLLVAVDGVVLCCVCCCVLFGFIDGKGFIALDFLAFFLLVFLFAVFVSAVKLFRTRISTLSLKSFTALVIVFKSSNVCTNGAFKLCCFTISISLLISSLYCIRVKPICKSVVVQNHQQHYFLKTQKTAQQIFYSA